MFDREGHLIAELVRKEWKVAPPPRTWDRNYTDDTSKSETIMVLSFSKLECLKIASSFKVYGG